MNLTKRTVEKLYAAPADVQLYNGNFNKASVRITNNKVDYELVVDDTHEILRPMSIVNEPCVKFIVWGTAHIGSHVPVPECLNDLVQKLTEAAKMTDEYAYQLLKEMLFATAEFYKEMGWR